jgi:hypothetical protein
MMYVYFSDVSKGKSTSDSYENVAYFRLRLSLKRDPKYT